MEDTKTLQQELDTAYKQVQELKSQLEKATDFIENASTPLHWVNKNAVIIWANQAELDLLGYSKDEYIGQAIDKFHADKKGIQTILELLHQNEVVKNFPAQLICKDGSITSSISRTTACHQSDIV